ncbi:MAG: ribonuclease P protein component [Gammaproteobacteria bacterium]
MAQAASRTLPRAVRLTGSRQYRRVFEQAVRSNDTAFTLLARHNDIGYARLGLVISRKCAKRAVARNRIKRLVRSSFRECRYELPSVDIVAMCRPVVQGMSNADIAVSLATHWNRLSRQCKQS